MSELSITVNCSEEQILILEKIAHNIRVDRGSLISEFLAEYIEEYRLELIESEEALTELQTGKAVSHEEVVKQFADRGLKVQAA